MRSFVKLLLFVPVIGFGCGDPGRVSAQRVSQARTGTSMEQGRTAIPVCENAGVNLQVREALRLVCAQEDFDGALRSAQHIIVIGFLGGFAKSGDTKHPEVGFGAYLRERYLSAVQVSVLSNHEQRRAMADVLRLLDTDHDGVLTGEEKKRARIILYGHSWGASEAAAFARELEPLGIPVLLTIQIDIVPKPGQKGILIPPNVEGAINFFQSESEGMLHGRSEVVAEDPGRTKIIGNIRMTYDGRRVDCRNYPWLARTFNKPHHEIENDARVWSQIASMIDARVALLESSMGQAAAQ